MNNAFGHPEPERSRYSYTAFTIHLCSLICQPERSSKELDRVLEPGRMPYEASGGHDLRALPVPAACLAELRRVVAEALAELRPLEERLRVEIDEPDRAEAVHRELILNNPGEARLFLRYHAEARTSFHRAFKGLIRVLKDDAARDADSNAEIIVQEEFVDKPFGDFVLVGPPDPLSIIPPPADESERIRRQTWRTYMRNTGWPNGDTRSLIEVYRSVGLLPGDRSPNEPEAGSVEGAEGRVVLMICPLAPLPVDDGLSTGGQATSATRPVSANEPEDGEVEGTPFDVEEARRGRDITVGGRPAAMSGAGSTVTAARGGRDYQWNS